MLNLPESIRLNAIRFPHKVAIEYYGEKTTYQGLNQRINKLSNALRAMRLEKGDKVSILSYNCPQFIEIYVALTKLGMIAVPINFRLVGGEIEYIVNQSESKAIIIGQEFAEHILDIRKNFMNVTNDRIIIIDENQEPVIPGTVSYEQLLKDSSTKEPGVVVQPSDYEMILYTSGTTGFPKGAVRTQQGMMWWYFSFATEFGINVDSVNLCAGPMFHGSFGTIAKIHLYFGGSVSILKHFDPEQVLSTIEQQKVTMAFFVPTMYMGMLNLLKKSGRRFDTTSLKTLLSSASPLPTSTKERILECFPEAGLHEAYGWTEVSFITNLRPQDQLRKTRCVGKPLFGVQLKLLNPEGKEVAVGEVGEIYANYPARFECYYNKPKETQSVFKEEFITGGDMGKTDDEGYLYIVDRKNDMIISGGENIYPIELDEILSKHPKVEEIAVIGVPDEKWGEAVKAVVVLKQGQASTPDEIINFCDGRLARYKWPKSVDFVEAMPKNAMGKLLKRELRKTYWEGQEGKI